MCAVFIRNIGNQPVVFHDYAVLKTYRDFPFDP